MTASAPSDSPSTGTDSSARRPRRRWPVVLSVLSAVVGLVGVSGAWAVHEFGPRVGVYLGAPSPQRYAEIALDLMENGYYASGPEWEAQRARVQAAADGAASIQELHGPLAAAVKVAGGKHSFFLDPAKAARSSSTATAEFSEPTVTTVDSITTVTIPALGAVSDELQQRYADAAAVSILGAADRTCGWIVDLRGNTGGTMYPMLSGRTPLLPNGTAMTFRTRRGEDMPVTIFDDGAGMGGTTISVGNVPKITGQPVAVLQDGDTVSSDEAVLTAFRGLDNVRSFGAESAGYTSANSVRPLYDGARLVLTESTYVDRDGVNLAEEPIAADHRTSGDGAEVAAREWLRARGCN